MFTTCVPGRTASVTKSDQLDWFLGRYDFTDRRNNKHPFREFRGINRNTKLEMDFLEVDSWDSDARYGPDCIYVHIEGVRLFLGIYANWRGKGYRSGIHGGIRWMSSSRGAPRHLVSNSRWKDQRHFYHSSSLLLGWKDQPQVRGRSRYDACRMGQHPPV